MSVMKCVTLGRTLIAGVVIEDKVYAWYKACKGIAAMAVQCYVGNGSAISSAWYTVAKPPDPITVPADDRSHSFEHDACL